MKELTIEENFPELKESEDERIRKEIIAFLTYYHTGQGNSVKYDDGWIAWLEKQGEQKSAWSEEDEDILDGIIEDIEVLKEEERNKDVKAAYRREIDWLKSIKERYTWKPSEEQMDALETAVSSLQSTALESLYQKLNKLM